MCAKKGKNMTLEDLWQERKDYDIRMCDRKEMTMTSEECV